MKNILFCIIAVICVHITATVSAQPWDGTTVTKPTVYDGRKKTVTIVSPAELAWLSATVNAASGGNVFTGWTITLAADLDLNNHPFTPIGNNHNQSFRGRFDGSGHKISNLKIDMRELDNVGLFGFCNYAVISDLTIESGSVVGGNNVGGFCGQARLGTTLQRCTNKASVLGAGNNVGGLIGYMFQGNPQYPLVVTDCANYGSVHGRKNSTGGLVGYMHRAELIESSANYGDVTGKGLQTGGIAGVTITGAETVNSSVIGKCANEGAVNGTTHVGGIVGMADTRESKPVRITACSNSGDISGIQNTGGIAGLVNTLFAGIENSLNRGNVSSVSGTGSPYYGGIAGQLSQGYLTGCRNTGNIVSLREGACAGGIAGFSKGLTAACYNNGNVSVEGSAGYAGGIVGHLPESPAGKISACYTAGGAVSGPQANPIAGRSSAYMETSWFDAGDDQQGSSRLSDSAWPDTSLPGWGISPPSGWRTEYGDWRPQWDAARLGGITAGIENTFVYPKLIWEQ